MTDPRFVAERCHDRFELDYFTRLIFRCEFASGHTGLHYASVAYGTSFEPEPLENPYRWGTQDQLAEEIG